MGLLDAGLSFLGSFLGSGSKPKVPGVPSVDLNQAQRESVSGNLAILPQASKLASEVNRANQLETEKSLEGVLPGGLSAAQNFITNQLLGIADVADTQAGIRNATAAGFNLGVGGSQFSKFGVVGHLGRSVAQQRQAGLQNFANLASFASGPKYNPASMFLNPATRVESAMRERDLRFQAAMAQAGIDAQPSRLAVAGASAIKSLNSGYGLMSDIKDVGGFVGGMFSGPKSIPQSASWYSNSGWNTNQNFGTPIGQWS